MDRLEKLKELEDFLYRAMQTSDIKSLASIARQYRETLKDIEALEGGIDDTDEIQKILSSRPDRQPDTDSEDNT